MAKPRPQSWKPSSSTDFVIDVKKRAITTPARFDRSNASHDPLDLTAFEDMPMRDDGG